MEPLDADEFLASYWEQKPFIAARREPGRFHDLLSEADVERLVCSTGIRYPAFRLVKEGAKLDLRDYTDDVPWRPTPFTGVANVERVAAEFEAGATLVLQGLHLHWEPLALFCRRLETELGHPVQANAYYTPRSAQGLPVHHDTHDVFSLQVAGEKRWLVYKPALPLPLKDQRYSPELGEPGDPVHDVTLRAGDTLYLPRGWLHQAMTSEMDSLHITIGVNVHTWLDAVRDALESCTDDVEFRRAVSGDAPVDDLLARLHARLGAADVAKRRRARLLKRQRPVLDGQLTQLRLLEGLTLETELERRPSAVPFATVAGDTIALAFHGKEVIFPVRVRDEVEFVAQVEAPFRAADLPGDLDDAGRLVFVRRLVREGFLRVSEPARRDGPSPNGDAGAAA